MKTTITILVLLAVWVLWSLFVDGNLETPKYSLLEKTSTYEVRKYESYIIAETVVTESESKGSRGFRELGGYIFGGNNENRSISMTAPVSTEETSKTMKMSFMMPSQFSMEALPKPDSENVTFREVPEGVFAVSTFTGWATKKRRSYKTEKFLELLSAENNQTTGQPQLLQYDRPFKFPFLRKNEVKIEIIYKEN